MKYPKEDWLQYQINQLKKKISDIGSGGNVPSGDVVTGVKGDNETTYRKGNVNITPENIGAYSTEYIDTQHKLLQDDITESNKIANEAKTSADNSASTILAHSERLDDLESDVETQTSNISDLQNQIDSVPNTYLSKDEATNTYIAKNGLTADLVQVGEDDHISGDFFETDQRLDIVLQNLDDSLEAIVDDINELQNKLDNVSSNSKLELKSQIQRIGEYRYLIIYMPYSDELLNEINNGKVRLVLYKQSKKKPTDTRDAYIKWVCPTESIGFGSKHFKSSFSEDIYTVASGGTSIPPSIVVGSESSLLEMAYNINVIKLTFNLSELAKAMSYLKTDYTVTEGEWGTMNNKYTDTGIHSNGVIGKQLRNGRVALRYKFRLFQETTQKYSEFTDTITLLYTRPLEGDYISVGMQIN